MYKNYLTSLLVSFANSLRDFLYGVTRMENCRRNHRHRVTASGDLHCDECNITLAKPKKSYQD